MVKLYLFVVLLFVIICQCSNVHNDRQDPFVNSEIARLKEKTAASQKIIDNIIHRIGSLHSPLGEAERGPLAASLALHSKIVADGKKEIERLDGTRKKNGTDGKH
jgi:hypothetical protein